MGWNGSGSGANSGKVNSVKVDDGSSSRKSPILKTVFVGMTVIALVLLIVIWFNADVDGDSRNKEPVSRELLLPIKDIGEKIQARETPERPAEEKMAPGVRLEHGVRVVSDNVRTNRSGAVIEKLKLADGRTLTKIHPKPGLFENASDALIATVLSVKPGQSMAPLPDMRSIDRDFVNSLIEPIRILDTDSEEDKEMKLRVKEARAYIAAEIKNGKTVQECLLAHCAEMERIRDHQLMAVEQMQKMRDEGLSDEDIDEFRNRVNETFRDRGIPELQKRESRKAKGQQ